MKREEILSEAKKCVCGDRDKQYGRPEFSFKAIADLWTAYITYAPLMESWNSLPKLSEKDVAVMMILMKIGRIATGQDKLDNWVDICGYAACGGSLATEDNFVKVEG